MKIYKSFYSQKSVDAQTNAFSNIPQNNLNKEEGNIPIITSAKVHPTKVVPGDTMTITAQVKDNTGIETVTADMPHEKSIDRINLNLINGTIRNGTWQNTWSVHDTEIKDYSTTITATNLLGKASTKIITWSDPANWWNISWLYRQEINISNTAGNQTNYQVKNSPQFLNRIF